MEKQTARTAILDKIGGDFIIKEYPIPKPAPMTMVLKVESCGICGTDIHIYHGRMPLKRVPPYPIILGHEVAGTIVALGEGLTHDLSGNPVKIGDRVCPIGAMGCNECYYCTVLHSPNRCPNSQCFGFYNKPDEEPYLSGGFAEYLYIHRPNPPFIKTTLDADTGMLLDTFATGLHAVQRARIQNGDVAVVQGAGVIGLVTTASAKLAGATKVIVVDFFKERLEMAKHFGADVVIDLSTIDNAADRIKAVAEHTVGKYGADFVFGCTGTPKSINEGLAYARKSGTYCEVGNFCDTGKFELNIGLEVVQRNINILGIFAQTVEHFYRGLMMLEEKRFPYEELVTHRIPLERIKEVITNTNRHLDGMMSIKVAIHPEL